MKMTMAIVHLRVRSIFAGRCKVLAAYNVHVKLLLLDVILQRELDPARYYNIPEIPHTVQAHQAAIHLLAQKLHCLHLHSFCCSADHHVLCSRESVSYHMMRGQAAN